MAKTIRKRPARPSSKKSLSAASKTLPIPARDFARLAAIGFPLDKATRHKLARLLRRHPKGFRVIIGRDGLVKFYPTPSRREKRKASTSSP